MIEIEGFVLSYQEYKERDAIIHLLTPYRIQSVYCRGVQSVTSKNRRLTLPFSKVRLIVEHKENRDLDLLIRGSILHYYYSIQESLIDQSICFVLNDALMRTSIKPFYYSAIQKLYESMSKESALKYTWASLVLAEILQQDGFAPEIHFCVSCGRKNHIETISLDQGGFLCTSCNHHQLPAIKKKDLLKFRALFLVKESQFPQFAEEFHYDLDDFLFLGRWYEQYSGIELASLKFLRSIRTLEKA